MAKKFDVLVVGELNIDLIFNKIKGVLEMGKEILADTMTLTLGSSSAICASNLSSLGLKVAFIGKLGNDILGQFTIDRLKEKGVDTTMVIIEDGLKTGATIALSYDEERAMITYQGAMGHMGIDDIDESLFELADHLHFSGYFFQPGFKNSLHSLFRKAKNVGMTTSLDVQWDPSEKWDLDLEKVLPWVDVFIPNKIELQKLTGQPNLDLAIDSIQNKCKYILIKCGNKGSIQYFNGKKIKKEAFLNTDVVDAIGAGDSFDAGYISKFVKGKSPEECQEFANLMGAISTTEAGGTTAFKDLDSIMEIAKSKFNYTER